MTDPGRRGGRRGKRGKNMLILCRNMRQSSRTLCTGWKTQPCSKGAFSWTWTLTQIKGLVRLQTAIKVLERLCFIAPSRQYSEFE